MKTPVAFGRAFLIVLLLSVPLLSALGAEPVSFLSNHPKLRLFIPASSNLGLQTAAVESLKHLKKLGYEGTVEVLAEPENKDRLPYLIPGLRSSIWTPQVFDGFTVTWWSPDPKKNLIPLNLEPLPLGWIMGDDQPETRDPRLFSLGMLLVVQPKGWSHMPAGIWMQNGGSRPSTFTRYPEWSALPHPVDPSPPLLSDSLITADEQARISALNSLLEKHAYLPAYSGWATTPRTLWQTVWHLQEIQEPLLTAPQIARKPKRGFILPVFSEYNPAEANELFESIRFRLTGTPGLYGVADIRELIRKPIPLEKLETEGGVLVIYMGRVNQPQLYKYFRESELPPLIEGIATRAYMERIGKPFLLCGTRPAHVLYPELVDEPGFDLFDRATPIGSIHLSLDHLEKYTLETVRPSSDVPGLFKRMKQRIERAPKNSLVEAFERADEILKESASIQAGACRATLVGPPSPVLIRQSEIPKPWLDWFSGLWRD